MAWAYVAASGTSSLIFINDVTYESMFHEHDLLTLSTMKSMASAILASTGPLAKFPRTIFLSIKAGINQKLRGKV